MKTIPTGLHRLAAATAGVTWLLLIAGGLVTSTGSGLAVPDWPLSFGTLFPRMEGGVLYEHSHRLIAGLVLILTLTLTIWTARRVKDRLVRRLVFLGLALVLAQALLGGATVLLKIPPAVSIVHAATAEIFFATILCAAATTSRRWAVAKGFGRPTPAHPSAYRLLFTVTASSLFFQILLGAVMRHLGAGREFPDWPRSGGVWLPEFYGDTGRIANWAHRTWAWIAGGLVLATAHVAWHRLRARSLLCGTIGLALPAILIAQFTMGVLSVRHDLPPTLTAVHLATGGLLWALCAVLALRSRARG